MKFQKRIYLFLLLLAVTAGGAYAQQTTPKIDDLAAQASSVTEFDVNGLKVLVKRRSTVPTVAAALFIRGGARNVNAKTAGIENLMLTSAIEAGKKYPRQTVRRELARTGSSIGASAGNDYSVVTLASTRQNFDQTWDIFADVTMNPAFDPADITRVRDQILTGIRAQDITPDAALNALEQRVIYAGHPYGNDVTGTAETLAGFTPQQLRDYHKQVMQTSQLLLVVVGDVDPDQIKARVAASFGTLPRGSYKETAMPSIEFAKPSLDIVPRTIGTNYVQGDFNAPSLDSPDYYAMRVAMTILQELVFQEVRTRRQLSYAPNAELGNLAANTANIYVTAVDANQAVKVMLDQIDLLKTRTIDADRIDGMTGQFLTTYYLKQQTNAAQAGDLARYELIGGGWRNSFEFLNRVNAVTSADIRTVANKYMKNIRFIVIGNPNAIDRSIFVPQAAAE